MEPDSLTRRNFLKLLGAGSVAMLSASLPNISGFGQRPTVRVITFAQG
ncbi:MAG: twin-arginine translocation signal domain-containing protein, partial [Candidatus Acetothermia bacterium]